MAVKDITLTMVAGFGSPSFAEFQFNPDQYGAYLGATGEQIRITLEWLVATVHPHTRKNFEDVLRRVMELDTRAQENENIARSLRDHGYARTSQAFSVIQGAGFEDAFRDLNERLHRPSPIGVDAPANRHERRWHQRARH